MKNGFMLFSVLLICLIFSDASGHALSDAAAALKPGEWVLFPTSKWDRDMDYIDVTGADGSTAATDWSDNLCWAPTLQQVLYLGAGHLRPHKFIRYHASDNTWYGDNTIPSCFHVGGYSGCFTHGYDIQAIDPAGGRFFYTVNGNVHQLLLSSNTWSIPNNNAPSGYGMGFDYFAAIDKWVNATGGTVMVNEIDASAWTQVRTGLVMGPYHNKMVYSARCRKVFFGGGNGSSDFYSMDAAQNILKLANAPGVIHVAYTTLTTDPVTGEVLYIPETGGLMYSYDPDLDVWMPAPAPPFANHALATPVADYGITFFTPVKPYYVYLYKHASPNDTLAVTGLTAIADAASIEQYLSTRVRAVVTYTGNIRDTTSRVGFLSLDPSIAAVDNGGIVTGVSLGTARIRVQKKTLFDTVSIQVTASTAVTDSVRLNVKTLGLLAGDLYPLHATGYFHKGADAFTRNLDTSAQWATGSSGTATVLKGMVTAVAAGGPADITASYDGKSDACAITVLPRPGFALRVNFKCDTLPDTYGWRGDNGGDFSAARGFGWSGSGRDCRDDRGGNFLLKSFVSLGARAIFRVTVPGPGDYIIKASLGDNVYGGNDTLWYNGTVLFTHSGSSNGSGIDTVTVASGNTLDITVNGKINYIVIISREGIDINQVALDNGSVVPPYVKNESTIRLAGAFGLSARPNPFNTSVFLVSRGFDRAATLSIFNAKGARVALFSPSAGNIIEWNAPGLGSGVYFAVLSAGMKKSIEKIIIIR